MDDHETHKPSEAPIADQAREWFVRMLQKPSAAERDQLDAWLAADPSHDSAYRRIQDAWDASAKSGMRAALREGDKLQVYLEAMDRTKSQRVTTRRLGIASFVLALLVGGAIWLERPNLLQDLAADYVTVRGERREVTLSDGSIVLLDADSAISENMNDDKRQVSLIRGAAFFDVVPSKVPFMVSVANAELTVHGTRFDARLLSDGGVVTLEHGSVSLALEGSDEHALLAPGQQVHFDEKSIGKVEEVDTDDALAWHNGRFVFYRTPLIDVVREVERYRPGRIVIVGSALANERVTGSFSLSDTSSALRSLETVLGFKMTSLAGRLTVIRP